MMLPVENHCSEEISLNKGDTLKISVNINENVPELQPIKNPVSKEDLTENLALNPEQLHELLELLNKYQDCIAVDVSELGCTNVIEMDIRKKPGTEHTFSKPYTTNAEGRENIK